MARRPPLRPVLDSADAEQLITELTIPDALLAWGRRPENAVHFPRDWARDIDRLVAAAEKAPLDERSTERLLSRVEGLVGEAVSAGHADLALGLDTQTAAWLYLQVTVPTPRGPMRIGPTAGDTWSWEELATAYRAHGAAVEARTEDDTLPEPSTMIDSLWRAKELLLEAFPEARITSIGVSDTSDTPCAACSRTDASCTMTLDSGAEYCASCWLQRVDEEPTSTSKKKR